MPYLLFQMTSVAIVYVLERIQIDGMYSQPLSYSIAIPFHTIFATSSAFSTITWYSFWNGAGRSKYRYACGS